MVPFGRAINIVDLGAYTKQLDSSIFTEHRDFDSFGWYIPGLWIPCGNQRMTPFPYLGEVTIGDRDVIQVVYYQQPAFFLLHPRKHRFRNFNWFQISCRWYTSRLGSDLLKSREQCRLVNRVDPIDAVIASFIFVDIFYRKLCFPNPSHTIDCDTMIVLFGLCFIELIAELRQKLISSRKMWISVVWHDKILRLDNWR